MLLYCDEIYSINEEEYKLLYELMPLSRKEKIRRYRKKEDQILGVASYALLRYTMYLSGISEVVYDFATNERGKPYIVSNEFYFNLSHTGNAIACVVEPTEVGVDIQERIQKFDKISRKVCTSAEMEKITKSELPSDYFTKLWALKESYVKCIGTGIWDNLSQIDFSDFVGENQKCHGHYFTVKEEKDYCVSVCSADRYVEMRKVAIEDVIYNVVTIQPHI